MSALTDGTRLNNAGRVSVAFAEYLETHQDPVSERAIMEACCVAMELINLKPGLSDKQMKVFDRKLREAKDDGVNFVE